MLLVECFSVSTTVSNKLDIRQGTLESHTIHPTLVIMNFDRINIIPDYSTSGVAEDADRFA
jgi:hypothetical protein